MDEARILAENGAEDGVLIWAQEQTAGRGRLGSVWNSPPGNLYISLITKPDCSPMQAMQLGFVTALGLGAAIGSLAPPLTNVTYKWPNDILVNGGKVCGILAETHILPDGELVWLILGIGMNLISHPSQTRYPATNLADQECGIIPPQDFLEAFCRHFLVWVQRWKEDGFAPIRLAWLAHAAGLERQIQVRLPKGDLQGKFTDLLMDGSLLLVLADGTERLVNAGEVMLESSD